MTFLIIDVEKILHVSDIFGLSKITENGEWDYLIKGKLIKNYSTKLLLTSSNISSVYFYNLF